MLPTTENPDKGLRLKRRYLNIPISAAYNQKVRSLKRQTVVHYKPNSNLYPEGILIRRLVPANGHYEMEFFGYEMEF